MGRPDGTWLVATGGGACCGRSVISDAALPVSAALTSCRSFFTLRPGALTSAATWWISPSRAETLLLTTMSMPATPRCAAPANFRLIVPVPVSE